MVAEPPVGVDLRVPNAARIYDCLLGGKDNYAVDRAVVEQLLAVVPEARTAARENHAFVRRAVRHLARTGIRQYIDVGTKLPAAGNVHETAAEVVADPRVVFADGDPVVLAHARALLTNVRRAAVVAVGTERPDAVLDDPRVQELLDLREPVAVVLDRLLGFIEDDDVASGAVRRLHERLAPGSHLVVTHITQDPEPEAQGDVTRVFQPMARRFRGRSRDGVAALFGDFELLEPGLTYTPLWRPDPGGEPVAHPERTFTVAAVAVRR
ncbi:SAM-dependent methyltransferase [Actinomadura atramentaria]|uniref:SAM-dependent methyltransferase n=1 Tax=Actinomadura atramentaria TaxID=1990 RepID=UPI0003775D63|nr:SAM-dependent methyltransferase [Actinomadura atramentaria]